MQDACQSKLPIRRETMRIAGKRVDDRRAHRGPQSLHRRSRRHRAGRAARACARGLRQGRTPSSRSSRATSASRSCCSTAELLRAPQGGVRAPDHGGDRAVPGRTRSTRSAAPTTSTRSPGSSRSATTARSIPAISPRMASRARSTPRASRCAACISAITPFNHPLNMVSHKLAPAIATNNRVVLKPTELTPLTALALADVLYEAGLPPEMLSVVTGNPSHHGRCHDHRPATPTSSPSRARSRSASTSPTRPATSAWCSSSAATIR